MTLDEFFEASIEAGLRKVKTDSEGSDRQYREQPQETERVGIRLVRFYPVFKGETEAQALKRKLAEEAAEGVDDKYV